MANSDTDRQLRGTAGDTFNRHRLGGHGAALLTIVILFAVSVVVRWPAIDRPLSHGYEWLTAHTLVVHKVWESKGGMLDNYFAQNMTFPGEVNKHINNAAQSNLEDHHPIGPDGNYYYLSHPPLGVIAPYATLKALALPITARNIQLFNLALQLICALLLYAIFCALVPAGSAARIAATLGAIGYIWLPANLWFHSNVYYVEIFVQLPFILTACLFALYVKASNAGAATTVLLAALGASVFAASYSEWLGVLSGAALFGWAVCRPAAARDWRLAATAGIASGAALVLFAIQHAMVVGLDEFVDKLFRQFIYRAYPNDAVALIDQKNNASHHADFDKLLENYWRGTKPALFLFAGLAVATFSVRRDWKPLAPVLPLLYLLALPPLAHHALLAGYTSTHWYSMLKVTPLLCLLLSVMLYCLLRDARQPAWFVPALAVFVLYLGLHSYRDYRWHYIDSLGDPNHYNILGGIIARHSEPDDVVFLLHLQRVEPQFLHYAQRNLKLIATVADARDWLRRHRDRVSKGIVFTDIGAQEFERISVDSDLADSSEADSGVTPR